MARKRKGKPQKRQSLSQTESLLLFALNACPGSSLGDEKWAATIGLKPTSRRFKNARATLIRKNYVEQKVPRSYGGPSSKTPVYSAKKPEDIPSFFVADLPKSITAQNDKFISLDLKGAMQDLDVNFVIRTKDYHKMSLNPAQAAVFALQPLRLTQEEIDSYKDNSKAVTICVQPVYGFLRNRDALHVIGSATRKGDESLRVVSDDLKGVVNIGGSGHLKRDCLYRFKITQDFDAIKPAVQLAKQEEVYNPHAPDNDFSHLMDRLDLIKEHEADVKAEAKQIQDNSGPFVAPKSNDNKFIISIDDKGTKCIDDAFSLCKHANGYTQETYLIAVPTFFGLNSDLYEASLKAGQSLYAGTRTVCPTIPYVLSHGKSSLHAGQDCPVLVVRSEYDNDGHLLDLDFDECFRKDIIRVSKNITPEDFKAAIQANDKRYTVYQDFMDTRRALAQATSHQKLPLHAIFNNCSEAGIIDSNIVADRMLHANALAGKWLNKKGLAAGYRNYGLSVTPAKYDYARFRLNHIAPELAAILPVEGHKCSAEDLKLLLEAADKAGQLQQVQAIIQEATLDRSQYGAINKGHSEIGIDAYATVSSAARRHVDYINQCLIFSELGHKVDGVDALYDPQNVQNICNHLNDVQMRQSALFQASRQRQKRAIMNETSQSVEPAIIKDISASSILFEYENYSVSEYFNTQALLDSGFVIDPERQELVAPSYFSGKAEQRYTYGDVLDIRLTKDEKPAFASSLFKTQILPK